MSPDGALALIGRTTAALVEQVLGPLLPEPLELGAKLEPPAGRSALEGLPFPLAVASLAFAGDGSGGLLLALPCSTSARIAGAQPADCAQGREPTDGERALLAEAARRVAAALADSFARALGVSLEPAVADVRVCAAAADAAGLCPDAAHVSAVSFALAGDPCLLVQFLPDAVVAAVGARLAERGGGATAAPAGPSPEASPLAVRAIRVRVGAELGRATLPLARAVGLGSGAVIELDREADDPVDLYVNGRRFAVGRLLQVEPGEWAIRVEEVLPVQATDLAGGELAA